MNKIKDYRNEAGLTIAALSEKAGVSVGYLSDLERDVDGNMNPTKDVMQKISEALNRSVPEVFFPKE
jgi:transcriptional regulator with XRE-family HTH domain